MGASSSTIFVAIGSLAIVGSEAISVAVSGASVGKGASVAVGNGVSVGSAVAVGSGVSVSSTNVLLSGNSPTSDTGSLFKSSLLSESELIPITNPAARASVARTPVVAAATEPIELKKPPLAFDGADPLAGGGAASTASNLALNASIMLA